MKKFLVNEQEKSRILKMYNTNSNLIKEGVTIPYSQLSVYDAGSSDPSKFIDDFVKNLIAKIDSDPAAKSMRLSGQMVLARGIFTAGASNSWGKTASGYDRENNMTPAKPTETVNYQKNYDLALERAKKFEEALWPKLAIYKIKKSPDLSVIKTSAYVLNTGGKSDSSRDQKTFPNPGQKIYVNLIFEYSQKLEEFKDATKISSLDQLRPSFVFTGMYFCNGKTSEGTEGRPDYYEKQCPANVRDNKHIAAFEIKWNPNVIKNPYTVPVVRWNFYWGADGKISAVTRQQFNNDQKFPINKLFPPSSNVAKDDATLKYMMGLNTNEETTGGKKYLDLVKPFI